MNAAIIGYGKSGATAKKLLNMKGFKTIDIYDDNQSLGYQPLTNFDGAYDIVVVSPGVNKAKYPKLPDNTTSEIELAYEFMSDKAKIIAITGTNGKSTTTHLAAQILNNLGVKAIACGNIGTPFAEAVLDKSIKVFVIELSSFQIDLLRNFDADAGCIINVTPDHLDRYGTLDSYYKSKLQLLKFINIEGLFVSDSDKKIINQSLLYHFRTVCVDSSFNEFPRLSGNVLDFGSFMVDLSKFSLFGDHNRINLTFALLLVSAVKELRGDVTKYIENLTGMPHRTELVGEFGGIRWINDSKGTNVDSVVTALKSIKKPSYLLLGGRDKKSDYTVLKELINERVSNVCYFGEAATLIHRQLSDLVKAEQEFFETLEDAVKFCARDAKSGATVILSPACTSFDEFKNYEDRGIKFAEYVRKYTGGAK